MCHIIHKSQGNDFLISRPKFPAPRQQEAGDGGTVTSRGCENIENCLMHAGKDEGVDINEFVAQNVTIKRFTLCRLGICYEF